MGGIVKSILTGGGEGSNGMQTKMQEDAVDIAMNKMKADVVAKQGNGIAEQTRLGAEKTASSVKARRGRSGRHLFSENLLGPSQKTSLG